MIYDRVGDADVKVTATGRIAALYIRKQNIFTEKKIYLMCARTTCGSTFCRASGKLLSIVDSRHFLNHQRLPRFGINGS